MTLLNRRADFVLGLLLTVHTVSYMGTRAGETAGSSHRSFYKHLDCLRTYNMYTNPFQ